MPALPASECSHCANRRRAERKRLTEQGFDAATIATMLKAVLCSEHIAEQEHRRALDRRNAARRERRARKQTGW